MSWMITTEEIPELARGAAVLGTGGGGDPYIGSLLALQALNACGPVTAVTLEEVPDDALAITVSMMGAPTVMVEKLPGLEEMVAPVRALEKHLGRKATHVACAEVGGVNSTIPIAAAAVLGLPLIDADGMGRAFPELQMVLPTLYGITASPMVIGDEKGNTSLLDTINNVWTERIARVACTEMGCSVMIAGFSMDGAQIRESFVPGSLSLSMNIGKGISQARSAKRDPIARVLELTGGVELFAGKVVDVERATTTGFARGSARIDGADETLTLSFQNEHLIAQTPTRVLATTPDLIMVLDHDSGEPITTEALRYGQRVRVISAPSDPRWHSAEALAMVGPRYFGYDMLPHRFNGVSEEMPEEVLEESK